MKIRCTSDVPFRGWEPGEERELNEAAWKILKKRRGPFEIVGGEPEQAGEDVTLETDEIGGESDG
jgi:hypothetical protein